MAFRGPEFQHLLDQIDIVAHISRYEPLKPEGLRFSGTHHHADSTGGRCLMVYPDTQSYYCFHGGHGGSVFDYEMHRNGADFAHTLFALCEHYQMDRPAWNKEQRQHFQEEQAERAMVGEVIMEAFRYYHDGMTDAQRHYYRQRGLSEKTINEHLLGYAPQEGNALVAHLRKKYPDNGLLLKTGLFFHQRDGTVRDRYLRRYVIPYWSQGRIVFSIGRSVDPQRKTHQKYVKHLVHSENYPYVSPIAVAHLLWGEDGLKRGKSILVAEGIFDALLAKQELGEEYVVISPVTVRPSNAQIQRLAHLLRDGGTRAVIFLNDNERHQAGEKGALDTAQKLRHLLETPETADGRDRKNPKTDRVPPLKIATLPRPPERDKIDLADYLSQGKVEQVRYWIQAARTLSQFEMYVDGNPQRFFDKHAFVPKSMADELRTEGESFLLTAERLHRYQDGVYVDATAHSAQAIQMKLTDRARDAHITETLKFLSVASWVRKGSVNPDCGKLNVQNGILDLATGHFSSHTPQFLSTIQIPVRYDEKATCPRIDRFFASVLPPDCLDVIGELFGYCLIQNASFHKAFLLTGTGANGKGTLIKLLTAFLGDDNVSKVPLQELDENRFKRAELFGKLANVFADLDSRALRSSSYFKTIVAGLPKMPNASTKPRFSFVPSANSFFLPTRFQRPEIAPSPITADGCSSHFPTPFPESRTTSI